MVPGFEGDALGYDGTGPSASPTLRSRAINHEAYLLVVRNLYGAPTNELAEYGVAGDQIAGCRL